MSENLNEDMLQIQKKFPVKKAPAKVVSENLSDLYATTFELPYSPALDSSILNRVAQPSLKIAVDYHTVEIQNNGKTVKVASDKFVMFSKKCLMQIFADLEKLKKMNVDQQRKISQLNAKVESLGKLKAKVDNLTFPRLHSGMFDNDTDN